MEKQYADIILLSNAVFTAENEDVFPGGVAISGNKIIAVGEREHVLSFKDTQTSVEDFGDALITPGFCDSHLHFILGCLFSSEADLSRAANEEDAARILKEFCDSRETKDDNGWVLGFNWYNYWWDKKDFPTRHSLDKYFPDKAVFLLNADAHAGWVNSKAMEMASIDALTPDPPYGIIHRLPNGEPSGFFEEMAMAPFVKMAYTFAPETEKTMIKNNLPVYARHGITSVNDMQYIFGLNIGNIAVYQDLAESGELTVRVNFANGLLDDIEYTRKLREEFSDKTALLYHNGVKEFMDGIINTHTAIMLDKYTDDPDAPLIFELMDFKKAAANIILLQKEGVNIQLHATGDGAVRMAMGFYIDAINKNGFTSSRMSLEHMDLVSPEDLPKMGRYKLIASVQGAHIALTEKFADCNYTGVVGSEREKYLWAFKSLLENGAVLALGTDYPVVGISPMTGVYRAVTRLYPDGEPEGGWNPQQKLTLAQTLRAYTAGGAYKCGKEEVIGKLACGMLADITVWNKNLFALEPRDYEKCVPKLTLLNGKEIFRA